ncbi:MAG: XrtA system polysaccharide chain length determinant, partial [Casimicrobiaceae bacterium]
MHQFAKHLQTQLGATWQFRWYAVAAAWLVGVAGWAAVAMIPDRYQASARVYVDTQSILRPLLAGLAMQPNVGQIVEMMSRTLISRPNVEKVIEMSNIKFDPRSTRGEEQTVDRLMRDLSIKGTGAQNFYAITYADNNPQQARQVVQSLLGIFEGSLGDKRKDSDSARTFIDDQLKTYGERLATAENALTEFKRRNLGMMPAQTQNFDVRMSEARTALNEARLELAEAEQGRDAIKARFSGESPPSLLDDRLAADGSRADDPNPEIDARIAALQQKLDTLRLSYTDRHPDIVAIPSMIEQLKAQKRKEAEQRQHEREARLR